MSGSGENVRKLVVRTQNYGSVDLSVLEEKRNNMYRKLSMKWLGDVARPTEQFNKIENIIKQVCDNYNDIKFRYDLVKSILKIESMELEKQQYEWDNLMNFYSTFFEKKSDKSKWSELVEVHL